MQAATQVSFFSCELLASNVGHLFAEVTGGVRGPVLLCCPPAGPTFDTFCPLLWNNILRRERKRERDQQRQGRSSQVKQSLLQI